MMTTTTPLWQAVFKVIRPSFSRQCRHRRHCGHHNNNNESFTQQQQNHVPIAHYYPPGGIGCGFLASRSHRVRTTSLSRIVSIVIVYVQHYKRKK